MLSYTLCKKLKDSGFPQPEKSAYYEGQFSCGCSEGADIEGEERKEVLFCGREYIYYPTLEQLIEACGGYVDLMVWNGDRAVALNIDNVKGQGKTPSEAVANLFLALKGR